MKCDDPYVVGRFAERTARIPTRLTTRLGLKTDWYGASCKWNNRLLPEASTLWIFATASGYQ